MDVSSTGASAPDEKSGDIFDDEISTPPPFTSGGDGVMPAPARSGGGPFSNDLTAEAELQDQRAPHR